ncbi:MAG TPA: zinc-dependent metalloprotease family protein [Blastocatellia bacterium]|nr:zinc-dependent metalloprotease family protein [Blastocatellia bacterium]
MKTTPFLNGRGSNARQARFTYFLIALGLFVLLPGFSLNKASGKVEPVNAAPLQTTSEANPWVEIDEKSIGNTGQRQIIPTSYKTLRLNKQSLGLLLDKVPLEFTAAAGVSKVVLVLPTPDGKFTEFSIVESPVVEPALAAAFPEIRTFLGQGIDDPTATMRFDWTPAGLHAMVLSASETFYVDPYAKGDTDYYITYYKKDVLQGPSPLRCFNEDNSKTGAPELLSPSPSAFSNGAVLRTYRMAVAATGEYTNVFRLAGDTDAQAKQRALAAITTTINRVNLVFERDLAVRFILVSNELSIIYTNPAADPYTEGDTFALISQNQVNLDNVIGNANYDIGHVFGAFGGGGRANLNVVCVTGFFVPQSNVWVGKGSGASTGAVTSGDLFAIDLVAHEIGHQFGALHSFNGGNNCTPNRTPSNAYEVGGGTTIMAYGGVCTGQGIQLQASDYYHVSSLEQMLNHINGLGSCAMQTPTNNSPPVVSAGPNYTIPKGTPFSLTATGSDLNGDQITYTWEEYDLGAAAPPDSDGDLQVRPIFRSYPASPSPTRTFPAMNYVRDSANVPPTVTVPGTSTHEFIIGEVLPTMTRVMTFQVTARDNRFGGGGISSSNMQLSVNAQAGPFNVTQPNTALKWTQGSQATVTWNVANTNGSPVNCTNVKITLSTDGGNTFPIVLAASTPNDGSEAITVPNVTTKTARVRIEAVGNIFFDISDTNFIIPASGCNYSISPLTRDLGPGQFNRIVTVTTSPGCSWEAKSNAPWIIINSGSGSGTGDVTYTVRANTTGATRVGTISVAGLTQTITQQTDGQCVYSLNSTEANYGPAGGSGKIDISTGSNCFWTATSNAPWIVLMKGSAEKGSSFLIYAVAPNTSSSPRTGTLTVAGFTFTVSQVGNQTPVAIIAADNGYEFYFNGSLRASVSNWTQAQSYNLQLQQGKNVVAIKGIDLGGIGAVLAEVQVGATRMGSNVSWKVSLSAPANWADVNFDDSGWANASEVGPYGIGPWGIGVSGMPLDTPAKWIWSADNIGHDVVYVRLSFNEGTSPTPVAIITADNAYDFYFNGSFKGSGNNWTQAQSYNLQLQQGKNVVAIKGIDLGGVAALLAEVRVGAQRMGSSASWKVSLSAPANWMDVNFDDSSWGGANEVGPYGIGPWGTGVTGMPSDTPAKWIWSSDTVNHDIVYVRFSFNEGTGPTPTATITSDNAYEFYFNGSFKGSVSNWTQAQIYNLQLQPGKNVVAIKGIDLGGIGAVLAEVQVGAARMGSNVSWKVSLSAPANWMDVNFDDSSWAGANEVGPYGIGPWGTGVSGMPLDTPAKWIWSSDTVNHDVIFIRFSFMN